MGLAGGPMMALRLEEVTVRVRCAGAGVEPITVTFSAQDGTLLAKAVAKLIVRKPGTISRPA